MLAQKYEYTSVTVRVGVLFSEDRAVNSKIMEMAKNGWELVSNTEARPTLFGPSGRMLQFRRPIPANDFDSPTSQSQQELERLSQLKAMLEKNLITQEEYDAKKSEILRRL